ncbi:MAG: protein translocase subunit SecD [Proteobacteria bacterium]|nr:protein translocase subunit SecD [Pseudomonadota bacterium]
MLQIPRWSKIVTALVVFFGILISLPNVLPPNVVKKMPHWLPTNTVSLGLDLQGGSYLLLEVQHQVVIKDRLETLVGDIRSALRKAHIGYTGLQAQIDSVSVRILEPGRRDEAETLIRALNPTVSGSVLAVGARTYDVTVSPDGTITLKMTDAAKESLKTEVVNQSIEVVRRRIDALGTREPTIERQGDDRIVVQVPGLDDPKQLIAILGKTAKMTFQLVDETANVEQAMKGLVPIGSELLDLRPQDKNGAKSKIVVFKRVLVSGDRLTDAHQDYDSQSGQPDIAFDFDTLGARQFAEVTKENVNHAFAVVLDKEVITAPRIINPIIGGKGIITGNFTVDSANELAILLRAGALPAPLKILATSTVGAELGKDSVVAGTWSAMGGLMLVVLFMIGRYGLFGLFADLALTLNVILLMAVLTLFGATLTLPGIAGIVLTIGMAVDANVLIFERMREEQRNGRSMLASIDQGFRRARATIFDANMTHLIASLILFQLGSGPVRGFAVTLGVGIITSFFTAVVVTRLVVLTWLQVRRPKRLAI